MNDRRLAGAEWFKSTRSAGNSECVEVAFLDEGLVGIRDSKNPTGPTLVFSPHEWDSFTAAMMDGEF
ncbi:DUF397 domain-containing protein [Nocardia tengchongensis]|uniref:DUF397 domain-containing protein n=1 Tax=Nocardia tengchongensis TaxID=2055889 RepID=UPI0036B05C0F